MTSIQSLLLLLCLLLSICLFVFVLVARFSKVDAVKTFVRDVLHKIAYPTPDEYDKHTKNLQIFFFLKMAVRLGYATLLFFFGISLVHFLVEMIGYCRSFAFFYAKIAIDLALKPDLANTFLGLLSSYICNLLQVDTNTFAGIDSKPADLWTTLWAVFGLGGLSFSCAHVLSILIKINVYLQDFQESIEQQHKPVLPNDGSSSSIEGSASSFPESFPKDVSANVDADVVQNVLDISLIIDRHFDFWRDWISVFVTLFTLLASTACAYAAFIGLKDQTGDGFKSFFKVLESNTVSLKLDNDRLTELVLSCLINGMLLVLLTVYWFALAFLIDLLYLSISENTEENSNHRGDYVLTNEKQSGRFTLLCIFVLFLSLHFDVGSGIFPFIRIQQTLPIHLSMASFATLAILPWLFISRVITSSNSASKNRGAFLIMALWMDCGIHVFSTVIKLKELNFELVVALFLSSIIRTSVFLLLLIFVLRNYGNRPEVVISKLKFHSTIKQLTQPGLLSSSTIIIGLIMFKLRKLAGKAIEKIGLPAVIIVCTFLVLMQLQPSTQSTPFAWSLDNKDVAVINHNATYRDPLPTSQQAYPICQQRWSNGTVDIVDMALVSDLVYQPGSVKKVDWLKAYSEKNIKTACANLDIGDLHEHRKVRFWLLGENSSILVVAFRGTTENSEFLVDARLFFSAAMARFFLALLPGNLPWGLMPLRQISLIGFPFQPVDVLASAFEGFINQNQYDCIRQVTEDFLAKNPDSEVKYVGHSLGGIIAQKLAALFNLERLSAIAFNSPGLLMSQFALDVNAHHLINRTINVNTILDPVSAVDPPFANVQTIFCKATDYGSCHVMQYVISELWCHCRKICPDHCRNNTFDGTAKTIATLPENYLSRSVKSMVIVVFFMIVAWGLFFGPMLTQSIEQHVGSLEIARAVQTIPSESLNSIKIGTVPFFLVLSIVSFIFINLPIIRLYMFFPEICGYIKSHITSLIGISTTSNESILVVILAVYICSLPWLIWLAGKSYIVLFDVIDFFGHISRSILKRRPLEKVISFIYDATYILLWPARLFIQLLIFLAGLALRLLIFVASVFESFIKGFVRLSHSLFELLVKIVGFIRQVISQNERLALWCFCGVVCFIAAIIVIAFEAFEGPRELTAHWGIFVTFVE